MTRLIAIPCVLTAAFTLAVADEPSNAQPLPPAAMERPGSSPAVLMREATRPRRHRTWHPSSSKLASVAAANQAATAEPTIHGFIDAVQVYPFSEGMIYRVYAAPQHVTDIALQPGEVLGAVAAGDTVRWVIGDTSSGSADEKRTHVLIKPFAAGLSTNVIITTSRRSYHLSLISTGSTAMTALSWTYPQDALLALQRQQMAAETAAPVAQGLTLESLHFDYVISGDTPPWRPLRAFDDGRQTFIELPSNIGTGDAPPLFLLGAKGAAELVNYRIKGHFYIVDRLFEAAELRLGTQHQDIVRVTHSAGLAGVPQARRAL